MTATVLFPHLWIVPVVALTLVGLGALWFFGFERWFNGYDGWAIVGVVWWVLAGILAVVTVFLWMPFDGKYHHFYRLEGTVTEVTNSFVDGSGEITVRPVFYVDTYDEPIISNTSRINGLEGADVVLTCTIAWNPYSLDVTNCDLAEVVR